MVEHVDIESMAFSDIHFLTHTIFGLGEKLSQIFGPDEKLALPYPRGVEFSGEEVIVLPLALIASLFVEELRSRQPFERMYVNNSNCNS